MFSISKRRILNLSLDKSLVFITLLTKHNFAVVQFRIKEHFLKLVFRDIVNKKKLPDTTCPNALVTQCYIEGHLKVLFAILKLSVSICEKSNINGIAYVLYYSAYSDFSLNTAVYMGEFNIHHTLWGYKDDDLNGLFIINWALNNNFHLMFDAKD